MNLLATAIFALAAAVVVSVPLSVIVLGVIMSKQLNFPRETIISNVNAVIAERDALKAERDQLKADNAKLQSDLDTANAELADADNDVDALNAIGAAVAPVVATSGVVEGTGSTGGAANVDSSVGGTAAATTVNS